VAQGLLDNGYPRPKVHIIPNAVEVENSVGTGSRVKERILLLGRLDPIKGHDILLEALPSLTQQFPSISVIFAGPAALPEERRYEEYLRRLALRLGVDDRVTVSGFVNPSRTLLREAAVVVVPSRAEGCPNVVLEAMAEMAPVVATRVGGTPEVVTDGVTGLLVDSECPEALGAGIARLLDRPDEAAERAEQAFEHVRRLFSPEAMVAAWEALYDEL
jgi:glycosyltransferase involved in cell wall biosynthesis